MVVLKFQLGQELRRITLPDQVSYSQLVQVAERLFQDKSQKFQIMYKDDDNEMILCSSDAELREAFQFGKDGIMRFFLIPISAKSTPEHVPKQRAQPKNEEKFEDFVVELFQSLTTAFGEISKEVEKHINQKNLEKFGKDLESFVQEIFREKPATNSQQQQTETTQQDNQTQTSSTTTTTTTTNDEQIEEEEEYQVVDTDEEIENTVEIEDQNNEVNSEVEEENCESDLDVDSFDPLIEMEEEPSSRLKNELAQLEEMGFRDTDKNLILLEKHDGNMLSTIQELLNE